MDNYTVHFYRAYHAGKRDVLMFTMFCGTLIYENAVVERGTKKQLRNRIRQAYGQSIKFYS